jgi:hypothetical protein
MLGSLLGKFILEVVFGGGWGESMAVFRRRSAAWSISRSIYEIRACLQVQ